MLNAAYKFRPNAPRADARRAFRVNFLWAMLLLVFVFAGGGAIEAAKVMSGPVVSIGPGSQFAIADFDGDGHPDLASVQAGQRNSGGGYWIEVNLSSVGRKFLQLAGPTGGLRIEARDVNGDHTVDLVLFTAWFRRPVAIFLNDGHGNFSRVPTAKFPGAFRQSNEKFLSVFPDATSGFGALPPSRDRICLNAANRLRDEFAPASLATSASPRILQRLVVSRAGRAPPLNALHA